MNELKVLPAPDEILEEDLSEIVASENEKLQGTPGFTLRVKPDRRRVQLPIPAELDRRRPR